MIRCVAIDDEPLALVQLENYIKKVPYLQLVAACQSALDAQQVLYEESVDAIFIDINMPDLSGMDFVRSLVSPPLVVFTTAYSEYAVEGFKVNAVDYLLKPFGFDDFCRAAEKVRRQYEYAASNRQSRQGQATAEADNALFVKSEYKIVRIDIPRIRYVEGMSEYLKFYVEGEPKPIIALLSMKRLEEKLPKEQFMRVHRSYIVNLQKIEEVSRGRIVMGKDVYIPVGDLYKDAFNKYIDDNSILK